MSLAFHVNDLEDLSDENLALALAVCFDPPVQRVTFDEVLTRKKGKGLPPQPGEEIMDTKILRKKLRIRDAVEVFLAVDQIKSLLPQSALRVLMHERCKERVGIFREWIAKLRPSIRDLDRLTADRLIPEDAVKERILVVVPSRRQFDSVKGRWNEWAWREKNYLGIPSPSEEGWLQSISSLCQALRENGVSVVIAADSSIAERVSNSIPHCELVEVNVPKYLPKIGYPRDPSVTWFNRPIIGNMALTTRKGEEEILNEVYAKLGCLPSARITWTTMGKYLVKAKMEGGNFFLLRTDGQTVLLTGIGIRGSNLATFEILNKIMPDGVRMIGIPLSGYIREWEVGAVHLDVTFAYLGHIEGTRWALVDPSRMGFYSALEYDRRNRTFRPMQVAQLAKELEIILEEPPRKGASKITMTNSLNLGKGRFVVDEANHDVNRFLERELGAQTIEVDIPDIEAGGGGPRCATRELFF